MTDNGHPITFGLSLYPSLDLVDDNTRLAQEVTEWAVDADQGALREGDRPYGDAVLPAARVR